MTGSLADRIARLTPEQREALERSLRQRTASVIPPTPAAEPAPLSSAQQRLWFLDRLEPGSPLYTIPMASRIRGPLDAGVLARALTDVVERHEALRTRVVEGPHGPVQVVDPPADVPVPVCSVTDTTPPLARGMDRLLEEARRPFDLSAGPLLRALLVRVAPDDHLFLLTVHHIVFDGWSRGIVERELSAAYAARAAGRAPAFPPLPVRFADYAAWQLDRVTSEAMRCHLDYWTDSLAGVPPLELPTDRPRPPVQTHRGAEVSFSIPAAVQAAVGRLARRERATPFAVLLAAFETLLHRYSGQTDFAVGMPVAGRSHVEVEGLAGFFVNTVAVRADLSGAPSFRDLVVRAREKTMGALTHQEAPFDHVVQAVLSDRDPSRPPIAQAVFALQNVPTASLGLPDADVTPLHLATGTAKFDLQVLLYPGASGLDGRLTYNADLFDASTAERLASHYEVLLTALLADPDLTVSAVPILTAAEDRQLHAWNPRRQPRQTRSLPDLFRAQAADTPQATALEEPGRMWSYAALDAWSDRIAGRLQREGVPAGAYVGIFAARSAAFVAGMLGVLKAGAAYVPLDPAYPRDRLDYMADDAALAAVLVGGTHPAPPTARLTISLSDGAGPECAPRAVSPDAPAYVIYTSGSTGAPKGVVVPHAAVSHLVRDTDYVSLGPGDRIAHLASPSFDAATFEVWGALLTGACLVVVPPDVVPDPLRLAGTLRGCGVTTAFLTTSLFNLVAREAPGAFAPLTTVIFGGEQADPHAVRAALASPPERLINGYGPTETTTFAAWHRIEGLPAEATRVPIGRPLAGTTLWVLDAHRQPVPVGVPGELYIGGAGVATGYLNRPALTAERFVRDPFSDEPGARMYRTGDLARRLPDGTLDFLGRTDRQVKIRGFRIEPGEVEARLRAHEAVDDAVVTVQGDEARGPRLVAHVVLGAGWSLDRAPLRAYLQRTLPEHLVPSAFGVIPRVPLTPNGKVDPARLPPLEAPPAPAGGNLDRLDTEAERHVMDVWEEVLGVRPAHRADDFFDLGGHSLLAVHMLSAVRRVFGHAPPLSALFEAPTVQAFALRVQDEVRGRIESPVHSMGGQGDGPPVLFVHGADPNCLQFVHLARLLGETRPVFGTQGAGPGGEPIAHATVEALTATYAQAWAQHGIDRPVHLVGLCYGVPVALELAHQLDARGVVVGSVIGINQFRWPSEPRRAPGDSWGAGHARALRALAGRSLRGGLWALSSWLEGNGRSLDGIRRRVPSLDGVLASEASRREMTRERFLAGTYQEILQSERDGSHRYSEADVHDALEYYERVCVRAAYRHMIEASPGRPFLGRFVMMRSDAHSDSTLSAEMVKRVPRAEHRRIPGPHSPVYEPFVRDLARAITEVIDTPPS